MNHKAAVALTLPVYSRHAARHGRREHADGVPCGVGSTWYRAVATPLGRTQTMAGGSRPEIHTTIKRLHNCWQLGNLADNTERTFVPENPAAVRASSSSTSVDT